MVFIHGGAFAGGEAEQGNDGTPVVKKSIEMGKPFILVSIQYRLGAFGFLPGKQLAGNTNLGLRDQRMALQWVQG
jgi:triacylglycerol lipase